VRSTTKQKDSRHALPRHPGSASWPLHVRAACRSLTCIHRRAASCSHTWPRPV
jgi:hypothetical protein